MNATLTSVDPWTLQLHKLGIDDWQKLTTYVHNLPYGRNKNRSDFSLVISERMGSCSSKHAFLKEVGSRNNIPNIELVLGVYKMDHLNTPSIGTILMNHKLDYLPEAHCYLKIAGDRKDFTLPTSNIDIIEADLLEEVPIAPNQVTTFKVTYHKNFLLAWLKKNDLDLSFDALWDIREQCIQKLSELNQNN